MTRDSARVSGGVVFIAVRRTLPYCVQVPTRTHTYQLRAARVVGGPLLRPCERQARFRPAPSSQSLLPTKPVDDLGVHAVGRLAHHEVADAFDLLQAQIAEELRQPVGPGVRQDRIAVAPEDRRRRLDREIARRLLSAPERRAIAVEAAAQRARLRIRLDVLCDLVVGPESPSSRSTPRGSGAGRSPSPRGWSRRDLRPTAADGRSCTTT